MLAFGIVDLLTVELIKHLADCGSVSLKFGQKAQFNSFQKNRFINTCIVKASNIKKKMRSTFLLIVVMFRFLGFYLRFCSPGHLSKGQKENETDIAILFM